MTFILAVNLSDRIYLAADSLVSKRVGDTREPVGYTLKLVSMASERSLIGASEKSSSELSANPPSLISVMFSGNRSFAHYIFVCLNNGLDSGELSTDINELIQQIDPYLKREVPKYSGSVADRICKIIIAGCSNSKNSVKRFSLENLNNTLGPQAGHIDDAHAVHGIQFGFIDVPDQKIFSYNIDDRDGSFGIDEIGEMYSVIVGGSKKLTKEEKSKLLKYFLNKRDLDIEGKDIIQFIRNNFSDSIGGAITAGYIDHRKRLVYFGYDIDKTGKTHQSNWSFRIEDLPEQTRFMATSPNGEEHDLIENFYGFRGSYDDTNLELYSDS
jgi:hypothetical protein